MAKRTVSFYIRDAVLELLEKIRLCLDEEEKKKILGGKRIGLISRNDVVELCVEYAWETKYRERWVRHY